MEGNEACLQCHTLSSLVASDFSRSSPGSEATLTAHTKHHADSTEAPVTATCRTIYTYGLLKTTRSHQISSPSVAADLATGRPNACNLCHLDKTSAGRRNISESGMERRRPRQRRQQAVAASVLSLLRGDAAERVIVGQALGGSRTHRSPGTAWDASISPNCWTIPRGRSDSWPTGRCADCPDPDLGSGSIPA
jgi:hypothetical protein